MSFRNTTKCITGTPCKAGCNSCSIDLDAFGTDPESTAAPSSVPDAASETVQEERI